MTRLVPQHLLHQLRERLELGLHLLELLPWNSGELLTRHLSRLKKQPTCRKRLFQQHHTSLHSAP